MRMILPSLDIPLAPLELSAFPFRADGIKLPDLELFDLDGDYITTRQRIESLSISKSDIKIDQFIMECASIMDIQDIRTPFEVLQNVFTQVSRWKQSNFK